MLMLWLIGGLGIEAQTSDWLSLDEGLCCDNTICQPVKHLFADTTNNIIYATGRMASDGYCNNLRGVGKWNGQYWEAMGDVMALGSTASIIYNDELIVSGPFTFNTQEFDYTNLAHQWTGSDWDTIPGGPDAQIYDFLKYDGDLYCAGWFKEFGDVVSGIGCHYDGEVWHPLEIVPEFSGRTFCVAAYHEQIYYGGNPEFINGQGESIYHLCYFDGTHYRKVGQGLQQYNWSGVAGMAVYKDTLYIAGQIKLPGDDEEYWMVTFDGDSLRPAVPKPNDEVNNLMVYNGALYATGGFTQIGDVEAEHLARYDGEEWIAINTDSCFAKNGNYQGFQVSGVFQDITVLNDTLYTCGLFYRFNQDTMRMVAKLNKNLTTDFPPPAVSEIEGAKRNAFSFDLYPNPSKGNLTLNWSQQIAGKVEIQINGVQGRSVYKIPPEQYAEGKHQKSISLERLSNGTFVIKLITPVGIATERWVKLE